MVYSYRKAGAADAARINELFVEMLRTIYRTDKVEGYQAGYLDKFFAGGEDRIFVAESGEDVVAFLSVEVYRAEHYIYLDDLSVTAEHRSRGIGTALIRMAEEYARSIGIPRIAFHVETANQDAHRLYGKLGYREDIVQGTRIRMIKALDERLPAAPG